MSNLRDTLMMGADLAIAVGAARGPRRPQQVARAVALSTPTARANAARHLENRPAPKRVAAQQRVTRLRILPQATRAKALSDMTKVAVVRQAQGNVGPATALADMRHTAVLTAPPPSNVEAQPRVIEATGYTVSESVSPVEAVETVESEDDSVEPDDDTVDAIAGLLGFSFKKLVKSAVKAVTKPVAVVAKVSMAPTRAIAKTIINPVAAAKSAVKAVAHPAATIKGAVKSTLSANLSNVAKGAVGDIKGVVRSPLIKVAVTGVAIAFPAVGVPAMAALVAANAALKAAEAAKAGNLKALVGSIASIAGPEAEKLAAQATSLADQISKGVASAKTAYEQAKALAAKGDKKAKALVAAIDAHAKSAVALKSIAATAVLAKQGNADAARAVKVMQVVQKAKTGDVKALAAVKVVAVAHKANPQPLPPASKLIVPGPQVISFSIPATGITGVAAIALADGIVAGLQDSDPKKQSTAKQVITETTKRAKARDAGAIRGLAMLRFAAHGRERGKSLVTWGVDIVPTVSFE